MRNIPIISILLVFTITGFAQQTDPAIPKIFYKIPGQKKAHVQKDIVYKTASDKALKMDVYSPQHQNKKVSTPLAAVIFVSGGSDTKHWNIYKNYGELTAANGMIAVNYDKRYGRDEAAFKTALEDTMDLIKHVRDNASKYSIDKDRIAVWTFSAGGALTVAALQENQPYVKAVVSYYGILTGANREQVSKLGDKLPPMLVVRSGKDAQFINDLVDAFVKEAIGKNVDLTFINYPAGQHAFENHDDTEQSREILKETFDFLRKRLGVK